ncbi:class I SAM-dependent methyltransferase, partial [Arachidicoccus sp.]|uniref:class I SAM-dependent methyltransferase n=1 Tax=Arachidicoccus sp. TaxID=1872624 RepID=UPI003D1BAE01
TLGLYPQHNTYSILDIGYGGGAFLKAAHQAEFDCYGYDITGIKPPDGCVFIEPHEIPFDIITMYDVLEHYEDLTIIKNYDARYFIISVPNCRYPENNKWFENWKHRRPDEHLHHFNRRSLTMLMNTFGYDLLRANYIEDTIRKEKTPYNILTAVFGRND